MRNVVNLFLPLIATIVMVSCAERKSFDVLNGEWSVVSVGEMAVHDSVDAFIGFDVSDRAIYGSTGCNLLTGTLPAEVDAVTPLFATLGSTRKVCADMTVEDALLPALSRVVDFALEDSILNFVDAEGVVLVILAKR